MDDPSVAERWGEHRDEYWGEHWDEHWRHAAVRPAPRPHSYLALELEGLVPGTALDAGCGEGAEAVWLAEQGWRVTGVDVSREALERAARLATATGVGDRIEWVPADLTTWRPGTSFDLVTSHYAHPDMPPTAFWARLAEWVAPGGTLLVVAHRHEPSADPAGPSGRGRHGHRPPADAATTAKDVTASLDPARWHVVTAAAHDRRPDAVHAHAPGAAGASTHARTDHGVLHDVVVRAVRRSTEPAPAPRTERTQP